MSSQAFYRKWRPQTLSEVFGQEHVTRTIRNALASKRVSHAYLFCGPRGTGKTSTGRILAKAVNCLDLKEGEPCNTCTSCQAMLEGRALDIIEIDAASNRGIDEIRDLREKIGYSPNSSKYKVYIIDEVHMLTEAASNALLKTLEEPPPHAIFVLATTEPHKVLATILSRCQRFDFHRLSQAAVIAKLNAVCQKEGIEAEAEALRLVSRTSTGSLRDAENLLEQLVAYFGRKVELSHAQEMLGISSDARVKELARSIAEGNIAAGLRTISSVNNDGLDLRQFGRGLVDYLRNMLLVKSGSEGTVDVTQDELAELKALVGGVTVDRILKAVKTFNDVNLRLDNYSPLPLELALVESVTGDTKPVVGDLRPVSSHASKATKAEPTSARTQPAAKPDSTPEVDPTPPAKAHAPKKQAPPTTRTGTPAALDGAVKDIDFFKNHWKEFILSLRGEGSSGNLDALLRSACEPIAVDGNTLVLGFYYDFHKAKMEDPKYRFLVERKLKELFGQNYSMRCTLVGKGGKASKAGAESPAVLRAALEMGGKIIDEEAQS